MKPREYCCCAIPLVNPGIYTVLVEQFVIGVLVGALAVATPSIVGASVPSFAGAILAAVCFILAAVQLLGFIGVAREKPKLYSTYAILNGLAIAAAFSVSAAWIIMSATRHNQAKSKCLDDFFDGDLDDSQGDALCTIFPWVDVGIMGGLWVILAILHIYLLVVVSSYGKSQRQDHSDYLRLGDPSQSLAADTYPLAERKDPWDTRESNDYGKEGAAGAYQDQHRRNASSGSDAYNLYPHRRNESTASASDVMNQPYQQPANYQYSYPEAQYAPYTDNGNAVAYPSYAYAQQAIPTPVDVTYSREQDPRLGGPPHVQHHPAEGQFRRKTPRLR